MNKPRFAAALILGATLTASLSLAPAGAARAADQPKHVVSRELGKPLNAAHSEVEKGKYKEAIATLQKADQFAKKTPWDQHIINELLLYAYVKTHDYADAVKPMQATIDDGFTDPAQVKERTRNVAVIYYQLKDYDKAIQWGERAMKVGGADATTYTLVSQAYYIKGDFKGALKFTNSLIDQEVKNGETPKETQLEIVLNSCIKLDDHACTTRALERMVTYYPKPEYWQNLVDSMFQSKQAENSDVDMLNIYRLANDVGAINRPQEYIEMAQLALEQGSPGEAQQVLEKAVGQNAFTDQHMRERGQRLLAKAKKQAALDQASLGKLEQDAAIAATGEKDVALGMAYLSYQHYDKAVSALQQGIAKGGVKNLPQAKLLLGIAQLKDGNKDAAVKTFHDVKGSDPVLQRLANLWSVRAREVGHAVASR
ncbi:MAG: tetratricopeptide repeat protein [Steroidobacteraceae bacterium]